MNRVMALALCVIFVVMMQIKTAEAQQVSQEDQAVQNPASREDIERATREMKNAIRSAEQKSVKQILIERENLRQQTQSLRDEQTRQLLKIEREQKEAREEAKAEAVRLQEQQQKTRTAMYLGTGVVVTIVLIGILVSMFFRGRKSAEEDKETLVRVSDKNRFLIHGKNISIENVRAFIEESPVLSELLSSNGLVEVPSVLELPEREGSQLSGQKFNCTTIFDKEGSATIRFDERPTDPPCAWKNRNKRAAEIAMQKTQAA
jgi:membrane-associated HD superfamily phosphohydrolase